MKTRIRIFSRIIAWATPVVALITGIVLTSVGDVSFWRSIGTSADSVTSYESDSVALWPVGLVLVGAGVLSLTATALVEAFAGPRSLET